MSIYSFLVRQFRRLYPVEKYAVTDAIYRVFSLKYSRCMTTESKYQNTCHDLQPPSPKNDTIFGDKNILIRIGSM